ncbi:hypothetical protein [Salinirarus marinus]|uniref:hypothetical protein n=1 Tax=Salinirarus marinus TaxID=3068310 RepID=UPI003C6CC191
MTDDATTRRRLVAALAALCAALFGAGFGTSRTFDPAATDGDGRFDLSVDFDVDRTTPPRSTPTDESADGPSTRSNDVSPPSDDRPATERPTGERRTADGDRDGPASTTADDPSLVAATQPLTLSNLHPGDEGTVTATLSLSGAPARLWFRGDVSGFDDESLTEPELRAGDDDLTGELQSYVDVRLSYDDGGTAVTVYDGPITGLPSTWTALDDSCFVPESHALSLRWSLDADAPNTIQTDALTFSFGVAASSCEP